MAELHLYWKNSGDASAPFIVFDLPDCPRIGEKVWFEEKDDEDKVVASVTTLVEGVMHIVETDENFAYVELVVSLVDRVITDDASCVIQDILTPEEEEAIAQAAMVEIRRKKQLLDADARFSRVQM